MEKETLKPHELSDLLKKKKAQAAAMQKKMDKLKSKLSLAVPEGLCSFLDVPKIIENLLRSGEYEYDCYSGGQLKQESLKRLLKMLSLRWEDVIRVGWKTRLGQSGFIVQFEII